MYLGKICIFVISFISVMLFAHRGLWHSFIIQEYLLTHYRIKCRYEIEFKHDLQREIVLKVLKISINNIWINWHFSKTCIDTSPHCQIWIHQHSTRTTTLCRKNYTSSVSWTKLFDFCIGNENVIQKKIDGKDKIISGDDLMPSNM